jgi:Fe(3+) dicitrate transport protein
MTTRLKIKITILIQCIIILCGSLSAKTFHYEAKGDKILKGTIIGTVTDENKNPLMHVNLALIGTNLGTTSGQNGKFVLTAAYPGTWTLGASMLGYTDYRRQITLQPGDTLELNVIIRSRIYQMEQVSIIADRKGLFEKVPGSLCYIDNKHILSINPVSGNEVFRRSPGVHVVDEEGIGLRANIGIRGLDPDRSRTVLVLEDGIPVSLSPYGEPEMYYTPAIERMSGVEILKGSGSILYGPQTIGGVINYITANPPVEPRGSFMLRGAQGGYLTSMLSYGNTYENTGYHVNYLTKQADSIGSLSFRVHDISARIRTKLSEQSNLGLKIGVYDETSNATYVGITQTMYESGGKYDFSRIAPNDQLKIRRYSLALTHNHFFNKRRRLTTQAYGYTTTRNWQRQDFAYNSYDASGVLKPKPNNYSGVMWGDESVPNGAIYMRNSTGNRNRQFEVAGLESRYVTSWQLKGKASEFHAGARILYERAFEQRINGGHENASSGTLQDDEIRTGYGSSLFAHNQMAILPGLTITTGLRMENYQYTRDIRRGRFVLHGESHIRDTLLIAEGSLREFIPGIGFNLSLNGTATVFGGVHRGFAPPRIKDAISNTGQVYNLDAEKSWNYELGIRHMPAEWINYEVTAFYMDFSNQVIPVAESAGGQGAGLVNGGNTLHQGVEAGAELMISQWLANSDNKLSWDGYITLVNSAFNNDRYVPAHGTTINIKGNKTPYAPSFFANTSLSYIHTTGITARITANYTGSQYTDINNTVAPSPDGRIGKIDSFMVFDANLAYTLNRWNTTFSVSGKNITNERYIITRRPQGIRLGLPRMITAGVKVDI